MKEQDAISFFKLNSKLLMSNLNWDYAAVKVDKHGEYYFEIGVYSLENELEAINKEDFLLYNESHIGQLKKVHENKGDESDSLNCISCEIHGIELSNSFRFDKGFDSLSTIKLEYYNIYSNKNVNNQISFPEPEYNTVRKGGSSISNVKNTNSLGTLGAVAVFEDEGGIEEWFAITCSHVVSRNAFENIGDDILSPAGKKVSRQSRSSGRHVIGKLAWKRKSGIIDLALVHITHRNKVDFGTKCLNIKKNIGPAPKRKDRVRISSYIYPQCSIGEVISPYTIVRESQGSTFYYEGLYMTNGFAQGGDSGSLVVNDNDEVIGIIVKIHGGYNSFFHTLNILNSPIDNAMINGIYKSVAFKNF